MSLLLRCHERARNEKEPRVRERKNSTWNKLFFWYLIYVGVNRQFEDPEFNSILFGFCFRSSPPPSTSSTLLIQFPFSFHWGSTITSHCLQLTLQIHISIANNRTHIIFYDCEQKIRHGRLWDREPKKPRQQVMRECGESEMKAKKNWATSHKTIYQRKLELLLSVQKTIFFITIHLPLSLSRTFALNYVVYDNKFDGRRTRELFLAKRWPRGTTQKSKTVLWI